MLPLRLLLLSGAAALALGTPAAHAAPGTLDAPFSAMATASLAEPGAGAVEAIATMPDGRIVTASSRDAGPGGTIDIVVHRLLPDGSLDATFDTDGAALLNTGGDDRVEDVAVLADGRILVMSSLGDNTVVQRLRANGGSGVANGALDPTFAGGGGGATLDSGGVETGGGLAVRRDGRIVVAVTRMTTQPTAQSDVVVFRLTPDGGSVVGLNAALDPSFDRDGVARMDAGRTESVTAVALRPDGGVLVAADSRASGPADRQVAVFVVKPDGGTTDALNGALDGSFDLDGVAAIDAGGPTTTTAIAALADGRILVAGTAGTDATAPRDAVVWRLRPTGGDGDTNASLDPSFGVGGRTIAGTASDERGQAMAVQPDGGIIVAGDSIDPARGAFAFRLTADGDVDSTFGDAGTTVFDRSPIPQMSAVALQADGAAVIGGSSAAAGSGRRVLYRLHDPAPSVPGTAGGPAAGGTPVGTGGALPRARVVARGARRFGARTRVTARLTGRRLRVVNANAFPVRVRVSARGAKARRLTVAAGRSRTVRLRVRRGLKVRVSDPAGTMRTVLVRRR